MSARMDPPGSAGLLFSIPARENRASNPYTAMLADGMEKLGWKVSSPRWAERFGRIADIVHLHWPQRAADQSTPAALRSVVMWLGFLAWQKARGAKLVWTTHNIHNHDARNPRVEAFYMRRFVRLLDGFVSLSEANRDSAIEEFPALRAKPSIIVPHPVYGDAYPVAATRRDPDRETVAFLGDIKPYKGLDRLIAALEKAQGPDGRTYLVMGRCSDQTEAAELDRRISVLRARGWTMERDPDRLSDQAMVDALGRTDLLVQPYRRGENSGLSLLAAERGVPMLVSPLTGLLAIGEELGLERVRFIEGELDLGQIVAALSHTRHARGVPSETFVQARDIGLAARMTDAFFRKLRTRP